MRYISTRGQAPCLPFDEVLLAGLATDGGLYVPERRPALPTRTTEKDDYQTQVFHLIKPFVNQTIEDNALKNIIKKAYDQFRHKDIVPLQKLDKNLWLMELYHGPTLAFKDVALQLLGFLFDHILTRQGKHLTVVGATSGDTGSAAIEACRHSAHIDIFMLHPKGRVSEVQRRQMTTILSPNVYNIALEGTFDDCQATVKALFANQSFRKQVNLSAVNSINWARIMAQIVYYVTAASSFKDPVSFAVPTGNFGNVYAAYVAREMGLPIQKLIIGTNQNDILDRFFKTGVMQTAPVVPTLSPSMDIQISSNFERLLFDLYDHDADRLVQTMQDFKDTGSFSVSSSVSDKANAVFCSARIDDAQTKSMMAEIYKNTGRLIDPHTAVGLAAARACQDEVDTPIIALACADAAKFPEAVEAATGVTPALPDHLADLYDREERCVSLPNDVDIIQKFIEERCQKSPH